MDDIAQTFNSATPVAYGGTGATDAQTARSNLGLNLYDSATSLTDSQQGQARANIGAGVLAGFRNKIINGDFEITQRGGPFTSAGYTLDRWKLVPGSGSTNSIQRINTASGELRNIGPYSLLWARAVAGSGTSALQQYIEGVHTLSDGKVTVTLWANANAATELQISLQQYFGTGGSPSSTVAAIVAAGSNQVLSLTATMQKFNVVFDVPSITGKTLGADGNDALVLNISRLHTSTNPTTTVRIRRVSLVEGNATAESDPFSPRHIQQELALCQRYYEPGNARFESYGLAGQGGGYRHQFSVTKRVAPTFFLSNQTYNNATNATVTSPDQYGFTARGDIVTTGGYSYNFSWGASAEL